MKLKHDTSRLLAFSELGVTVDRRAFEVSEYEAIRDSFQQLFAKQEISFVKKFELLQSACPEDVSQRDELFASLLAQHMRLARAHGHRQPAVELKQLQRLIDLVSDKAALFNFLVQKCLPDIRPDDYESLSLFFEVLRISAVGLKGDQDVVAFMTKGRLLLMFLQGYQSIKPQIDSKRLPFHDILTGDVWKIITPEITFHNLSKIMPIAKILALQTDAILVACVENTLTDEKNLFEMSQTLVEKIADPETAIMAAKMAADKMPLCKEKVRMLFTARRLSAKWLEQIQTIKPVDSEIAAVLEKVCVSCLS
jgi:hypothetical protein